MTALDLVPAGPATVTVADELRRVRERIADPEHWTHGAMARDKDGQIVGLRSPPGVASRWCLAGACSAEGAWDAYVLLGHLSRQKHHIGVESYNDSHNHAAVLALVDDAIAIAGAA